MTKYVESLLLGLLLALGLNHFVLGMFWLGAYDHQGPVLLAFGLYLLALLFSLYGQPKLKISALQAYLNLAISLVVPALVLSELPFQKSEPNGSYETWFVAAISLVLAITTGRGWPVIGYIGLAALWAQVLAWGGPAVITTSGLIGATTLVTTAWALGRGLKSTMDAASEYHGQVAVFKSQQLQGVAVREARQKMLQTTSLAALPILERIANQGGQMSEADLVEVALLESRLRDEIQGNHILNDGIRLATREARKRGVEVSFEDEGGLDHTAESELLAIQQSIIDAINGVHAGKVHVAAPQGQSYKVGIIATRPEAAAPDLWLRLP